MPHRLADETSPYLLQHKDNPVDWYPWGPEALARARDEEKPIFLSIGYSACHWCHVMEHESFENSAIAAQMNEHFVCVKVDREERPDLDQIYMNAVQLMTGQGGWPMSVFLTPDLEPFYGGTYWPPTASRGMPGFDQVILAASEAWGERRDQVLAGARQMTSELRQLTSKGTEDVKVTLDDQLIHAAAHVLERSFDHSYGGFGQAPKFPHPMELQLLLRWWQRAGNDQWLDRVRVSLDRMAAGGLYDHLGGGFARYCVDARWLVPHFEKMLYDNALLSNVYLEAFLVTGDANYRRVVCDTLDYVLRDMTDDAGAFYSTEDADSEGVEGKFYVWTPEEVREVLGEDASVTFCRVYDVTDGGNFEGKSILNLPKTIAQSAQVLQRDLAELADELATSREKLLAERAKRIRPGLDDKVLVSWNGLMIDAMARAGAALGEPQYIAAARRAADFILKEMKSAGGQLLHTWRDGTAKLDAYLDDYTTLGNSLVSLYEATWEEKYVASAVELMDTVLGKFGEAPSSEEGQSPGFFYTSDTHEELLTRTKDFTDNATPGGNSMAAMALVRLGKLLGRSDYLAAAHRTLEAAAPLMQQIPMGTGQMLLALDLWIGPTPELVFVGGGAKELAGKAHERFIPRRVIAAREDASDGISSLDETFAGRAAEFGEAVLYVCESQSCQAPVNGQTAIEKAIEELATDSHGRNTV
ncbi:MAG: thioredoxin domain-containing protein [Aeoliella sp.]